MRKANVKKVDFLETSGRSFGTKRKTSFYFCTCGSLKHNLVSNDLIDNLYYRLDAEKSMSFNNTDLNAICSPSVNEAPATHLMMNI